MIYKTYKYLQERHGLHHEWIPHTNGQLYAVETT